MKILHNTVYLLAFFAIVAISGCSKGNDNKHTEKEEALELEGMHTFEITLINTEDASDKVTFSGKMPINKGGAAYTDKTIGSERIHEIMLNIGTMDKPNSIFGRLNLDDNKQPIPEITKLEEGGGGANLIIHPKDTDDYYNSVSGSIKVNNLKYAMVMPTKGSASFTIEFTGKFIKNAMVTINAESTYEATGKITIAENKEMGSYKEP